MFDLGGSLTTAPMPKMAYGHRKAIRGGANMWWVHNDLVRILELAADGRDANHRNMFPQAWPFDMGTSANQQSDLPLDD